MEEVDRQFIHTVNINFWLTNGVWFNLMRFVFHVEH